MDRRKQTAFMFTVFVAGALLSGGTTAAVLTDNETVNIDITTDVDGVKSPMGSPENGSEESELLTEDSENGTDGSETPTENGSEGTDTPTESDGEDTSTKSDEDGSEDGESSTESNEEKSTEEESDEDGNGRADTSTENDADGSEDGETSTEDAKEGSKDTEISIGSTEDEGRNISPQSTSQYLPGQRR